MATEIERIENILTSEYSVQNYVQLVQELFDNMKIVAPEKFRKEFTNFSSHIAGSSHVGNYTTSDGKKMIIFAVQLLKRTYVEGSRSTQRSYAKKLIENAGADAAMIAFYTEGDPKWRLSYVRLDYEMKFENGKLQTAENMTPAKRYSFLVGKDEPCHTAIDRFRKFITDHNFNPTLDELEEAFSVEAVTNEFFNLYCEKFKQLLIHLEDNPDFVIEAEQHNFTAAQFAKKLMGQIVFLYFLQKKGWLGVGAWPDTLTEKEYKNAFFARGAKSRELIPIVYRQQADGTYKVSGKGLEMLSDADEAILAQCVKGKPWGTGPHNFMRRLFEWSERKHANFFDDFLEPLFYDALNQNRSALGYYDSALHCRIPFLSGGLFEPIDGYDWKHNDFAIPNEIFSNRINGNPRTGDGILDIFDRYNFTMSEDEPMEREVAIDPEMLGKVFENLLEINDRKSKGAFYTPREIVHYMCQESLINYLVKTMQTDETAIRDFIIYGDFMKDEDTVKDRRQGNGGMYISEDLFKVDDSGNIVVNRLLEMDKALANVRVADPAVGSGAFPLGMLNEIVRARQNITAYMAIGMRSYDTRMMYSMERAPHTLKYETIKNCLYAADLEPSAVDITQLRLWLALVIDDEINPEATNILEGHRNPLPLPNLECNILCGNSLSDEFEGIQLINQSNIIGTAKQTYQMNMYQSRFDALLPKLIEAQDKLFRCDDTDKKKELLEEISSIRDMIIMSQMEGKMTTETKERYDEAKRSASKPYVLWQLDFARVFKEKGGFDIVIGNPPYLESRSPNFSEELKEQLQRLMVRYHGKNGAKCFPRGADLLIFFFELSLRLINKNGLNSFITQNSWLDTEFGRKFQDYLLGTTNVLAIIDSDYKYFETADINTVITFFEGNTGCKKSMLFARCHRNLKNYSLPANANAKFDVNDVTYKVLKPDSEILQEMKWGFIFNTEDELFNIIATANEKGKTIGKISAKFEIGQGLNLKKSAIVTAEQAKELGIPSDALIPFFTTEEAGIYSWNGSDHFIVRKSSIEKEQQSFLKGKIDLFDDKGTRKIPPVLMMPRGIGARHYCCVNNLSGYSASGVDVYNKSGKIDDDTLRIWLYTNSSLFWLIREIAGRKNLGGGMLKAEAVDIKPFAILFNFSEVQEIKKLYEEACNVQVQNAQDEASTQLHRKIDAIVFDYLGLPENDQVYIVESLIKQVNGRYNKTKAK